MRDFLTITNALGDEPRVRALMALRKGELCVCQIIDLLGLAPSTVSKHMAILHAAGLVERRKEGKWHYYRLAAAESRPSGKDALPSRVASPMVQRTLEWLNECLNKELMIKEDGERVMKVKRADLQELCGCYRC